MADEQKKERPIGHSNTVVRETNRSIPWIWEGLVAEGAVKVIELPGENPRYEVATSTHHHHFSCTSCHRIYDVAGCPGNLRRLAPRGFTVEDHEVTLYGRCSDCGKREVRAGR